MAIPVTLIPGDGIGPEITDATIRILEAAGMEIDWDRQIAGMAAVEACADPLPKETIDSIARTKVALKGPLATPIGGGYENALKVISVKVSLTPASFWTLPVTKWPMSMPCSR